MSETVFYNSKNLVGIGSVGIGTTSPSAPLHVQTNTTGGDPTTASAYIYNASTSTGAQSILGIRLGASTSATNNAYTSYDIAGYYGFSTGICGDVGVTTNRRFSIKNTWNFTGTECLTILNSTGNVGVGTTSPGSILHVAGSAAELRLDTITSGDSLFRHYQDGVSKSYIGFSRAGAYMYAGFGADVWRAHSGETAPRIPALIGVGNRAVYSDANGLLTNTSSDARLKSNVHDVNYGLATVQNLRPVSYNWSNVQSLGSQLEIGFIAQEVQQLVPEVIGQNSDGMLSLDYPKLTAVLAKAVQELSSKLQTAQNDIDLLESRLAAIEALIGTNTSAETDTTSSGTRAEALLAQV